MATVLTLEEVASYLRVHPSTIDRMLKRREIPAFRADSDWRFNLESIDRWRFDAERRDRVDSRAPTALSVGRAPTFDAARRVWARSVCLAGVR
jgi:excisionase family DNA binding protein